MSRPKIDLRTYNIAPLSSNVGVIEFAGTNTTAIGDFLLERIETKAKRQAGCKSE